jgi:photoactive yellow protein
MESTVTGGLTEAAIFQMDKATLDAYPDGVITLARDGTIVGYNASEAKLARRNAAETIGLNFFNDVAPCTAVQDFKGRFDAFAAQPGSAVERFAFVFKFAWGRQDVSITMIRKANVPEINLLVSRRSATA